MANVWARDRANFFYLGLGLWGLAAVAIGFSTTYALPMARRSLSVPAVVHLHGALCLSWVMLFIIQCTLVRGRRTPVHRQVGLLGIPIALGILISGMATALWATARDLPTLDTAPATMIGTLTSLSMFLALVVAAILMRRRPDWHKRLMLLATVVVLWPAFFRFRHLLPFVPRPDIWLALVLADMPILIAALRDKLRYGRVHPVLLWLGSAVFTEQAFEVAMFETSAWRAAGMAIYEFLT